MSARNAARILALVEQAKGELGPQILANPARLTTFLNECAPEFAPQIRALGGALALGALTRFAAAADAPAEAGRLAADVAMLENLPEADARAGAALAAGVAGKSVPMPEFGPASPSIPADNSWIGATEVVSPPPQAPSAPPPPAPAAPQPAVPPAVGAGLEAAQAGLDAFIRKLPPQLQNKWVLGAVAAVLALVLLNQGSNPPQQPQAPQPGPAPQQGPQPRVQQPPPPGGGPQGPASGGGGALTLDDFRLLVDPQTNPQLPQIAFRDQQNALIYAFAVPTDSGTPYLGVLSQDKSAPLWQRATLTMMTPGAQRPENISAPGGFQIMRQQNVVMRQGNFSRWQSNGLNISDVCIAALRPDMQDIPPRQFTLCVLTNNCQTMAGCGVVP